MRVEHWWFTLPLRLKSILRRGRVERELDEELQFHLENKIEEGIAGGHSPREARLAALRAMGGVEQRKEEMRDMRRIHWLTDFVDDIHYAIRSLRRAYKLTAFVVITLALGIGMTAASFSMSDALIFRPYPVSHPDQVLTLVSTSHDESFGSFSYREYLDIRDRTKSYDGVVASASPSPVGFIADPKAMPRVKGGMLVSGNFFRDADDREVRPVQADRPAHDGTIARELVLPEVRPQYHDRIATGNPIFVLAEAATDSRFDAEHAKEVAGDEHPALHPGHRLGVGDETDGAGACARDDAVVALRAVADVEVLAVREAAEALVM